MDKVLQTALDLAEQGVAVHFLKPRSKAPIEDSWSTAPVNDAARLERTYRKGYNLGIRLGKYSEDDGMYLHAIDLDIRKPEAAKEAKAKLVELFGEAAVSEFVPVQSGSGGHSRHLYFWSDQSFKSKKLAFSEEKFVGDDGKSHRIWEIELFGTGKQIAAPPSIHPDTGKPYTWGSDRALASARVVKSTKLADIVGSSSQSAASGDSFGLEYLNGRLDWDDRKIRKILRSLEYEAWGDDYEGWLKVGMALHHETGGSRHGLDLWHDFSEESAKYDPEELDKRWRGFGRPGGEPIRFISLVYETGLEHMVKLSDGIDLLTEETLDEDDDNEGIDPLPYETMPDGADIPLRPWLVKPNYMRKQIGVTVAPGGVGKSTLTVAEALSMASGIPTIGPSAEALLTVWHWNLEDPEDELARRFDAARRHYGITRDDLAGRLFVNGAEDRLVIATEMKDGVKVAKPIVKAMIRAIKKRKIDVVQVDPFVSSHQVSENSNMAIQAVADTWNLIARECNCAIHLVHHTRKMTSGASGERTADDSRGAGSLNNAARMVRVLNPMSKEVGEQLGICETRRYVRMDNGKANFMPPTEKAIWFQLYSTKLMNGEDLNEGDEVGVAVPWELVPKVLDSFEDKAQVAQEIGKDRYRSSYQCNDWVGYPIGRALGLMVEDEKDRREINARIKNWLCSGFLQKISGKSADYKKCDFIVVGESYSQARPSREDLLG